MAGVKDTNFRTQKQAEVAQRQADLAAKTEAEREANAKRVYERAVKKYEHEQRVNTSPVNKYLDRKLDSAGDLVRSVGKWFGTNRMTSGDDEAQMQARKDVKGYKKGGSVRGWGAARGAKACKMR